MTLDLINLINDQAQTKVSTKSDSVTGRIQSLANNAKDLPACISAIGQLAGFLFHEDKEIRNLAATALTALVEKAVKLFADVKDPKQLLEYSKSLLEVIGQVQEKIAGGSVSLDTVVKASLERSKEILEELLRNNSLSNRSANDSDEFVSSKLNNTKRNLIGGGQDQFVSSLNQPAGRLAV